MGRVSVWEDEVLEKMVTMARTATYTSSMHGNGTLKNGGVGTFHVVCILL